MKKILLALSCMLCFMLFVSGCGIGSDEISKEDLDKLSGFAEHNQLTESEFKTAAATLKNAGLDFSRISQNTNNVIFLKANDTDYLDKKRIDEINKMPGVIRKIDADKILALTIEMDKKDGKNVIRNISANGGFKGKIYTYFKFKKDFDISKLILSKKDAEKLREISEKELAKKLEKEAKEAQNMKVTGFFASVYIDRGIISSDTYAYDTAIEAEYDLKTGGQTLKKKIFNKINITKDFKVD